MMARPQFSLCLIPALLSLISLVLGWSIDNDHDRKMCQHHSQNPMDGCDSKKTVFVDVVGSDSKFKSVQSGISFFA